MIIAPIVIDQEVVERQLAMSIAVIIVTWSIVVSAKPMIIAALIAEMRRDPK